MPAIPARLSKTEKMNGALYADALRMIEYDVLNFTAREKMIPQEWHQVAEHPSSKKLRVTLCIEEDVVKFFRAMGPGYQPRMNDVLKTWVFGRLARLIGGPDVTDLFTQARDVGVEEGARPQWGEMADLLNEGRAKIAEQDLQGEIDRVEAEVAALEAARAKLRALEGE